MALPIDRASYGEDSERATGPDDYKKTCQAFIEDISKDYLEWVDFYQLPEEEDKQRRERISAIVKRTNEWLENVPYSIKAVDVIMNDGIQKMAEATAGHPFQLNVLVNGLAGYTKAKSGNSVDVRVKAVPREGRKAKLGWHQKGERFRLESTCEATIQEQDNSDYESNPLDMTLTLDTSKSSSGDVVSFTVIVSETKDGSEVERRGISTLVHLVDNFD